MDYVCLIINDMSKRRVGGTREGLDGYTYLKHPIQLWPGDWVNQIAKIDEAVDINNCYTTNGGSKRLFRPFERKEFWKCIGCILLEVTYGKKGHKLWSDRPKYSCRMAPTKIRRDVRGKTDLYKVCCYHYRNF